MTQEEKQLLLTDLCARLPYNVKVRIQKLDEYKIIDNEDFGYMWLGIVLFDNPYHQVKPYLRPMSSMTDSEKEELKQYLDAKEIDCNGFGYIEGGTLENYVSNVPYSICSYVIDWLNSHHFDYRGLIEKGLAIEAPEEMYGKI